jgi:hypothetical protein
MKLVNFEVPVESDWFDLPGSRLDSKPYLSGSMEAKALLEKLAMEKEPLYKVTQDIFSGSRFARIYVEDPKYGVPFLGSTDILNADLSDTPNISQKIIEHYPDLLLQEGWTLITCSGTIGRMTFSRPDMVGMAGSQHLMRVVPDPDKILPGYLYAYLSSKFGVPQVVEGTYGAIIQHIEPQHIADLPVPRLGSDVEDAAHQNISQAATLRCEYQSQVKAATARLFSSVGLQDITASEWHVMGRNLGFVHMLESDESLRAMNFNPRLEAFLTKLSQVPHMLLRDICRGGDLQRGLIRFKRIDCEPAYGVKLVGQRELFWWEPEGRWISSQELPDEVFMKNETVLIAARGTLGEHEVYCRGEFITGPWLDYAYSEDHLRVRPGNPSISGAFLFAFLRSEMVFRCLRSISMGTRQQDLHRSLLARLPVPMPDVTIRSEIEQLVRDAYKKRHEASRLEKEAVAMVEMAIQEGAARGWQP